jgi:putative heme-binding domain-containing protein
VRIAFDRPLSLEQLQGLAEKTAISYGEHVRAGDRFETLKPPYEVVMRQSSVPRRRLEVLGASVSADHRTLVLATEPQPLAVHYAVRLPDLGRPKRTRSLDGELPQLAEVDLDYNLTGVEAAWIAKDGSAELRTWLPHFDLAVAREFTAASAEHDELWAAMSQPGRLVLRGQLNLWSMLRPAVQPGAKLDYELPAEEVTLVLRSDQGFSASIAGEKLSSSKIDSEMHAIQHTLSPSNESFIPVEIELNSDGHAPEFHVSYFTAEDDRARALQLVRVLLPWAERKLPDREAGRVMPQELAGGDWLRGRQVFVSADAQCSKCHKARGEGGTIGPDLSNLVHRDYASVLRDIQQPSAGLNPDYISYGVRLANGQVLSGTVRTQGQNLIIGDAKGAEAIIPRDDVEEMKAMNISTMPEGLHKAIGSDRMRDLLTFLLMQSPEEFRPAKIEREGAPPPRPRSEVDAAMADSETLDSQKLRPLKIVLVAGPKDHGASEHDYPAWQDRWSKQLALADKVQVSTAQEWPSEEDLKTADVLVWYSANPGWSPDRAADLDKFLARGGGMVYLHFAVHGRRAPDQLANRIGLAWQDGRSKFRHGALTLKFNAEANHPITRNLKSTDFIDESYWNLTGDPSKITVLATAEEEGAPQPLIWAREAERGRVFGSILGHYSWTFDDPLFRLLVLRGIAWSAGEPVDRFNELVTVGARIDDSK